MNDNKIIIYNSTTKITYSGNYIRNLCNKPRYPNLRNSRVYFIFQSITYSRMNLARNLSAMRLCQLILIVWQV
jgi:hypothetical protein